MTNSAVKILGIYIGHDAVECNEKNWIQRIQKMEKLLDSWRKRYLTLSGKVCIINSLALSKLYYCASILNFPNSENVKTINRLIFSFIWGSRDRIKRNTLIGRPEQGGIGVVDIESKFKSLKASWVARLVEIYKETSTKIYTQFFIRFN